MPYPRNPFFTGREDVLQRLHDALHATGKTALTQAIRGLGGIGKTQTALEYAYRHQNDYSAVLWTQANDASSLTSSFVEIARLLDLPEKDQPDQSVIVQAVHRWLANNDGWLLLLDNADKPEDIQHLLPPNPKGHLLLTSRAHSLATLNCKAPIRLKALPEEESLELLLHRAGRPECSEAEKARAQELAQELGGLPLALEQAGAYLANTGASFADYLISFRVRRTKLFHTQKPEVGNYEETVATTWKLNFEAVGADKASVALRHNALPEGHPDIAGSLNNLAELYRSQGRYAEAEPLIKQALALRQQVWPEGHPDIATSLSNLAGLYRSQGRYEEAEPLYKQALEIFTKALGPEHPNTKTVAGNYQKFLEEKAQKEAVG